MAGSGPNPALAPIRRWVLYSRKNLVLSVLGVLVLLFGAGQLFGEAPSAAPARVATDAAPTTQTAGTATSQPLLDELPTVSDADAAAMTDTDIARSAPATAMAYARAFVDISAGDLVWAAAVADFGAGETAPAALVGARPTTSVAITGPTSSTPVSVGVGAPRQVRSTVPTDAGDLMITLVADDDAQVPRWVVDDPLPSLDLSLVAALPQIPEETAAATPTTPSPGSSPPATTSAPAFAPAPTTAPESAPPTATEEMPAPEPPARNPAPVPVPGPIPIPDLDTPLPGAL